MLFDDLIQLKGMYNTQIEQITVSVTLVLITVNIYIYIYI